MSKLINPSAVRPQVLVMAHFQLRKAEKQPFEARKLKPSKGDAGVNFVTLDGSDLLTIDNWTSFL